MSTGRISISLPHDVVEAVKRRHEHMQQSTGLELSFSQVAGLLLRQALAAHPDGNQTPSATTQSARSRGENSAS
jgi:hypothetical protein